MRPLALTLAAVAVACGGETAEDRRAPLWPDKGCPPSHELRGGRCTAREIYVPGGGFMMGKGHCADSGYEKTPPDLLECPLADQPHWVEVAPFWADATLYTWADYAGVYFDLSLPYDDPTNCPSREIECAAPLAYSPAPGNGFPGSPVGNPADTDVTCGLHGKRAIREAEWEWLATWGGTRKYPWGDSVPTCSQGYIDPACELSNPVTLDGGLTSKVASHLPTPEGVYDLTGNGGEWVLPSPDAVYGPEYPSPVAKLPPCPGGQEHCGWKGWVTGHRGGAVGVPHRQLEGAYRGTDRNRPSGAATGFRCVRPAQ